MWERLQGHETAEGWHGKLYNFATHSPRTTRPLCPSSAVAENVEGQTGCPEPPRNGFGTRTLKPWPETHMALKITPFSLFRGLNSQSIKAWGLVTRDRAFHLYRFGGEEKKRKEKKNNQQTPPPACSRSRHKVQPHGGRMGEIHLERSRQPGDK